MGKTDEKTDARISALEGIVDPEVMGAIGASVRGVVQKHDEANRQAINELAHESIKSVLSSFPDHARAYVVDLFNKRSEKSFAGGKDYSRAMDNAWRQGGPTSSEKMDDLLLNKRVD